MTYQSSRVGKSLGNSTQDIFQNLPQNSVKHQKKHVKSPLKLTWYLFIHKICQIRAKKSKKKQFWSVSFSFSLCFQMFPFPSVCCLLEIADLSFSASLPLLSLGKLGLLCTVHPISSVNATDLQLSSLIIIIIIVQQSSKLSLSSPKIDYLSVCCWPSNLLICKSHY